MKKIKTNEQLIQALNNKLSLILTKTKTCSVCDAIKQRLELIKDDYPIVDFYELYLEDHPTFQGQQLIFTVPTVIVLTKGKEVLRESRFVNIRNIKKLLDKYLKEQ